MTRASQHVPAAAASDVASQSVVSPRQAKKRGRRFNKSAKLAAAYIALRLLPEPLASTGAA